MSDNHEGSPRARAFVMGLIVLGFAILAVTALMYDGHDAKGAKKYGSTPSLLTLA